MYPLPDGLFAARNQWYIAAWSEEVTREPMERWILDEPVALYRTESGKPVALEGRCPHRSFPLGRSRVSGDNIQCGYHGITFRPDGSCAAIPSQSAVPAACRVRSYPIVEQWRWLWIWMGDPALADESLIPSEDELGLGDGDHLIVSGGYNLVAGRYMLLHDNLFDLTHVGYLHMPSFGSGGGAQDTVPEVKTGQNWVSSVYTQRNVDIPDFFSRFLNFSGKVDRVQGLKLFLPCLHVGGTQISLPQKADGTPGELLGSLRVYHAVTPATRHSTNYFFAAGQSWSSDRGVSQQLFDYQKNRVIPEDIMASEYIEEMIQKSRSTSEVLVRADAVCVTGRRMFEKMIHGEMTPNPVERPLTALG
ncbi:aromatic ring-hydroxylating dioxygenase subunit alpha [Paraburkholderia aspalathi]|uniref:Rieske 2Fe-2S domain-containing protein n=1 Tax=Paraburkholderia aspalathi TaxID=1324617 RepID=UPI0038B873D5